MKSVFKKGTIMCRWFAQVLMAAAMAGAATASWGLQIEFDYSLDRPFPFFDTQEKKDVLEAAADVYERLLTDQLAAIEPSGDNWWRVSIPNPGTGGLSMQLNLSIPEDTIHVFVGGRDIPDEDIASVDIGVIGVGGSDPWTRLVQGRGQANAYGPGATDFGPWGGAIAFDNMTPLSGPRKWNFDLSSPPAADEYGLFTAALHEIPKVLGIGTADSWDTWTDPVTVEFAGPFTAGQHGGPVPLDGSETDNLTHWAPGTMSTVYLGGGFEGGDQEALNTRVLPAGVRKSLTDLEVAALQDIGWQIACSGPPLQPGDADMDGDFDRFDLVQVLQRAKYLTGLPATWGEGDWNGAPGGCPGHPPLGDGLFNQLDIIAALSVHREPQGPYAALTAEAVDSDRAGLIPADSQLTRAAVPEPSALVLLAAGLLILVVQRQKEPPAEGHLSQLHAKGVQGSITLEDARRLWAGVSRCFPTWRLATENKMPAPCRREYHAVAVGGPAALSRRNNRKRRHRSQSRLFNRPGPE